MIFIWLKHCITRIVSHLSSFLYLVPNVQFTVILNNLFLVTKRVINYTVSEIQIIGIGLDRICFLIGTLLQQLFVLPTRQIWSIFSPVTIPGHCISLFVIFNEISFYTFQVFPDSNQHSCMSLGRCQKQLHSKQIYDRNSNIGIQDT